MRFACREKYPRTLKRGCLLALHEEFEFLVLFRAGEQFIAGLLGKRGKVLHRTWIGGDDAQHLARREFGQRLLGTQNGKRAVQSAGVEFLVEVHVFFLSLDLVMVKRVCYCILYTSDAADEADSVD